ncbi:MAG: hypothetical protein QXD89_01920 [Candidatus Aenigmatarchaeota archaeon]
MMKTVSEIISVVLILVLSLGLVSTALMYGYPMIRKTQDRVKLERVLALFVPEAPNSLVKKLEYISNFGGSETISLDVDGIWEVRTYSENSIYANSISFSFFSRATNVRSNQLISLTPGESCPPIAGLVGGNSPFVVCVSGTPLFDGFNITYFIFARNLTSENFVYSVKLVSKSTITRSTLKMIRIARESLDTVQEGDKKVIIVTLRVEV